MKTKIFFLASAIFGVTIILSCKKDSTLSRSPFEEALSLLLNKSWLNSNTFVHAEIAPYCSIFFHENHTYELSPRGNCEVVWESGTWTVSEGANPERPMSPWLKPIDEVIMTFHLTRTQPVLPNSLLQCQQGVAVINYFWEVTKCTNDSLEISSYSYASAPCDMGWPDPPLFFIPE